jgi:hypothetical protein
MQRWAVLGIAAAGEQSKAEQITAGQSTASIASIAKSPFFNFARFKRR